MKNYILLAGLIAGQMACFGQGKPDENVKRTWSFGQHITRNKFQPLECTLFRQDPEHLVGSCVLNRKEKTSPQLVIQGHLNKSGEFTPNVSLAVSDREDGNWKTIESSLSDKVDATLTGAAHIEKLFMRIQLDAFQPYIGKFKFCQVTLQTGEADVFPMVWLTGKDE